MSEVQAADSVIREEGTADVVNADPRKEFGQASADTSTPIAAQSTRKEQGSAPDADPRSEAGRSF